MQKVDLCEACAREVGATSTSGFSLADLLLTLKDEPRSGGRVGGEASCPGCGMTAADFRKTGRVGCGTCYETFHAVVVEALKETQKSLKHRGKVPARYLQALDQRNRLDELRQRLREAVSSEQFEEAAALRDQIRLLESMSP
ncbi:MAG: UvrB/UvrC motif-containing protein [Verrucomicrobiia bacterium]